ncbi:MAG: hypothetical protein U0T83_04445 [Bacteriovoracaceae bacterium]
MNTQICLGGLNKSESKKIFEYISKKFKNLSLIDVEKIDLNTTQVDIFILDFNGNFNDPLLKKILKVPNAIKVLLNRENRLSHFELYLKYKIDHILGINGEELLTDLEQLIMSFLLKKNQYLDLLKKPDTTWTLDNPNNFRENIKTNLSKIDFSSYFSEIPKIVELVLEETITNALVHAPVDLKGKSVFKNIKEVKNSTFKKKQYLKIYTKKTNEFFMLSIMDQYGSLNPDIIKKYLAKGIDQIEYESKPSGAGLGLCLIFNYTTRFIIDIRPGISTTISLFFKNSKSSKKYFLHNKSFHIFKYELD